MIQKLLNNDSAAQAKLIVSQYKILEWVRARCDFEIGLEEYAGDGMGIYEVGINDDNGMHIDNVVKVIKRDGKLTKDNFCTTL